MAVQNLEIPTENLLSAVVRLPAKDFERFFEKARELRRKQNESVWTKREVEMIKKLNDCVLSDDEQTRFIKLVKKRQSETITKSELKELIALTNKSEGLNLKRIKVLVKLATAKNKTLDEIMDALEIRAPEVI